MIHKNRSIASAAGRPLMYDLYVHDTPRPLIILVHGFKSYKDWGAYPLLTTQLYKLGYQVCVFNFSHNGGTTDEVIDFPDLESFRQNTFSKEMLDLQSMLNHLFSSDEISPSIDMKKVLLIGHSRGGSIAAIYASEDRRITHLVTINAIGDLGKYLQRFDHQRWNSEGVIYIRNTRTQQEMPLGISLLHDFESNEDRYTVLSRTSELLIPVLIVHACDDETVPHSDGLAIAASISDAQTYFPEHGGHTLGARHPWGSEKLPIALGSVFEEVKKFFPN